MWETGLCWRTDWWFHLRGFLLFCWQRHLSRAYQCEWQSCNCCCPHTHTLFFFFYLFNFHIPWQFKCLLSSGLRLCIASAMLSGSMVCLSGLCVFNSPPPLFSFFVHQGVGRFAEQTYCRLCRTETSWAIFKESIVHDVWPSSFLWM